MTDSDGDHGTLDADELVYPEFVFEDGDVTGDGGFDLSRDLDAETMDRWLRDLAGALASHDLAVESPDGHVRFGVAPQGVDAAFDPDDYRGTLEVTFRFDARAMFVADDPDQEKVGARGGKGFIPLAMLTEDLDSPRCYNWIDDPGDP